MIHHLYAIVERLPDRWRPPAAGIGGAAIVPRRVDDFVVLSSLLESVPTGTPRTLALHQDVVATLVDATATLPFRYGTGVPAVEFQDWLERHRSTVAGALEAVRGCVEMTVKLLRLDGAAARHARRENRVGPTLSALETDDLHGLAEALVERAALPRWRYSPSGSAGNVAAAVAFLVPRVDLVGFLARIAPVASHAGGITVVTTGPWPPYSFVPELGRAPLARMPAESFEVVRRRAG